MQDWVDTFRYGSSKSTSIATKGVVASTYVTTTTQTRAEFLDGTLPQMNTDTHHLFPENREDVTSSTFHGENPDFQSEDRYTWNNDPCRLTVLGLVLDELTHQYEDALVGSSLCSQTFNSMSLVHSSWTTPCMRALGRVIQISGPVGENWRKALSSPLFGSWSKRLLVSHNYKLLEHELTMTCARRNVIEELCLTRTAFHFYRNLHTVSLSFKGLVYPEEQYARHILSGLSCLQSLRHLIINVTGPSSLLKKLCEAIPDLKLLEKLVVVYYDANVMDDCGFTDTDNKLLPPFMALKDITFDMVVCSVDPILPILTWFTARRDSRMLESLQIHYWDTLCTRNSEDRADGLQRILGAVNPALQDLLSLVVHATMPTKALRRKRSPLSTILGQCTSLKCLKLCLTNGQFPDELDDALMLTPVTLECIHVSKRHRRRHCEGEYDCSFQEYKRERT